MPALAADTAGHRRTVVRLLRDLYEPRRFGALLWIGFVPGLNNFLRDKQPDLGWLMAGSMAIACVASLSADRIESREYRVLPVTDRDLWITRWVNATVMVPAVLLLYKALLMALAAVEGRTLFTPDALLLSTLFDALYAGAFLPVPHWLDGEGKALAARSGRSAFLVSLTLLLFSTPLFMVAPFFFARSLPEHVGEFSIAGGLMLALGLSMAAAAFLWTPRNGGAAAWVRAEPLAVPLQPATPDTGRSLKGIPVVLWSHARSTAVLALLFMSLAAAISPFLPAKPAPQRMVTDLFLVFALVGITFASVWAPWLRRLKVLPISANQINALFVLTPLLTWLVVWAAVLLVHGVLEWPLTVELGPAGLIMCAGLSALSHAAVLPLTGSRFGQTGASMLGLLLAAGTAVTLADHRDLPVRLSLLTVGVLGFALAAAINHFTLRRSTSSARAYRFFGAAGRP